jgi:hypothetical protein
MVIRCYAHESAIYRVSHDIDQYFLNIKDKVSDYGRAINEAISHYAVEDAILKVYGSEMLDYVVDETVQVHGGMGYSAEMPADRSYRDSRINRIFEGTNEINRLLVVDTAMKRAMKGEYPLFEEAEKLYSSIESITEGKAEGESYYTEKKRYISNFKKAALILMNAGNKTLGKQFFNEQEIMNCITDMIIEIYIAESLALRVEKLESMKGAEAAKLSRDMLDVFVWDAAAKVNKKGKDAIYSFAANEEAARLHKAVCTLTRTAGVNVKDARRRIADKLIEDNTYKF